METSRLEKQPGLVKMHKVAIIAVAAVGFLLSFSLFSWISFELKTVNETGWQLLLTGGFLITYLLLSMRLL